MLMYIRGVCLLLFFYELQVNGQQLCPTAQSVTYGQKGIIKCRVPNIQGQRSWKIHSTNDKNLKDLDPLKFQIEPDEIVMDKVTLDFNEIYTLQLEILNPNTKMPYHKSNIEITVKASPTVQAFQKIVNIEDETTIIGCTAIGKPTPKIKWFYKLGSNQIKANETSEGFKSTSFIEITDQVGLHQCIATNEVGSSLDNIIVNSNNVKIDYSNEISKIEVIKVTDSSISFNIEANTNGKPLTHIYFLYTLYSENSRMKEDHSGSLISQDGLFEFSGLPKGTAVIFHFAVATDEAEGLASTDGFTAYLLPPTPEIALKSVTDEFVYFEWRIPFSARFGSTNTIDFFEIKYGEMTQQGDNLIQPTCFTEIKVSSCMANSFKLYRKGSTYTYSQIEIRAHNNEGYSDWSRFLISHNT